MIIRRLLFQELEKNRQLFLSLLKESSALSFPKMNLDEDFFIQQFQKMEDHLKKQEAVVFVSENNGEINGFIWCHEIVRMIEKRLHIAHFCVKQQCRRQGIGTALLKEAERYAQDKHYYEIDLMVTASNQNAVDFYTANSFHNERFLLSKNISSDF